MDKEENKVFDNVSETLQQSQTSIVRDLKRNVRETATPSAWTTTTIYTASWWETITGINMCNTWWSSTTIWLYVVPIWWTAWSTNAIMSSVSLLSNESKIRMEWITPARWDIIQVKSTSGSVCFTLFGKK